MCKYLSITYLIISSLWLNVVFAEKLSIARVDTPEQKVASQLLEVIYRKAGHEVSFVNLPSKRSLTESSKGRLDGEVNRIHLVGELFPTLKRIPTEFNFAIASAFAIDSAIELKEGDWESLRGYNVGYQIGALYAEKGLHGFPNIVGLRDNDQLFQMLESGRVDVVVAVAFDGRVLAKKMNLSKIQKIQPVVLHRMGKYHYLHESKAHVIRSLDKVIIEMTATGELARLRSGFMEKLLVDKSLINASSTRTGAPLL